MILHPKMLHMTPFILCRGVCLAAQASVFVNFWVFVVGNSAEGKSMTEDSKIEQAMYTFISMGFGMIIGAFLLGLVQDKYGHRASLSMLLSEIVFFSTILLVVNENQTFDWTAHVIMFGMGIIDNTQLSFMNVVLGFEFESQILPFGAKNFIENIAVFAVIGALSLGDLDSIESYRTFFVC